MRKIILALFIILFFFSIGIAELQEEELSEVEKAILRKACEGGLIEMLHKHEETANKIVSLYEEIEKLEKGNKMLDKDIYELMKEANKPEEKDDLSLLDKYPDLTKKEEQKKELIWQEIMLTNYWYKKYGVGKTGAEKEEKKEDLSWFNKYGNRLNPSTIWVTKTEAEKLEEENDRLEDLLEEIRSERFSLEQDMMMYRWELEDAKPRPWEYQVAAEQAIEDAMFDMMMWPDLVLPPLFTKFYYPGYLKKKEHINYEPLLFTLCTDSKGKMDWNKYGWLKILLKNK